MIKKAVIDFSAFIGEDRNVVIKELTIMDLVSNCFQHWIFKPPKDTSSSFSSGMQHDCGAWHSSQFDSHNKWLSRHYHGLGFSSGSVEYESLLSSLRDICCDVQLIYAASSEKAKVLEKLLEHRRAVFSLELLGCPPLSSDLLILPPIEDLYNQKNQCLFHHLHAPGFYCTQSNVHKLVDWCSKNRSMIEMNDPAVREKTFTDWKLTSPSAKQLADEGFVKMLSFKDTTKCVYCGVKLFKWEEGDNSIDDHSYNSPFCSFLRFKEQKTNKEAEMSNQHRGDTSATLDQDVTGRYVLSLEVTHDDLVDMCKA